MSGWERIDDCETVPCERLSCTEHHPDYDPHWRCPADATCREVQVGRGHTCLTIYISGPMSGYPDFNFPAFRTVAKRWREDGHTVVNPAEINADDPARSWEDCIRRDLRELLGCNAIALLPGWLQSRGANIEVQVARALQMAFYDAVSGDPL